MTADSVCHHRLESRRPWPKGGARQPWNAATLAARRCSRRAPLWEVVRRFAAPAGSAAAPLLWRVCTAAGPARQQCATDSATSPAGRTVAGARRGSGDYGGKARQQSPPRSRHRNETWAGNRLAALASNWIRSRQMELWQYPLPAAPIAAINGQRHLLPRPQIAAPGTAARRSSATRSGRNGGTPTSCRRRTSASSSSQQLRPVR